MKIKWIKFFEIGKIKVRIKYYFRDLKWGLFKKKKRDLNWGFN